MGPKTSPGSASKRRKPAAAKKGTAQKSTTASSPCICSTSCIYSMAGFVLLALTSLGLSTLLFSLVVPVLHGDLAWTSRYLKSWSEVAALLSWRVLELAIPWVLGYDARDVTCLIGLIHLPTYSLLLSFYGIRPTTVLTVSAITVLSTTIPFFWFRPLSTIHHGGPIANRHVLTDNPTTFYTTIAAALVYTMGLYLSYATWLPAFLVTHFDGLPDISAVHEGAKGFITMLLSLIPAGYAARDFLFVSSTSQSQPDGDDDEQDRELSEAEKEERHGELLITSLYRKYWLSLAKKTRVLISRSATLALMTLANTIVQLVGTISGAEAKGALGWAGIWATSAIVNGIIFGWIEAVEGV